MPGPVNHRIRVCSILIALLPLVALACRDFEDRTGSSGLVVGPVVSAAGVWEGSWTTQIGSGDFGGVVFIVEQDNDNNLFGCSCWTGTTCWDVGGFRGTIEGSSFLPVVMEVLKEPLPDPRLGVVRLTAKLDVIGDRLAGTFDVVVADPDRCDDKVSRAGDEGTLDLVRNPMSVDVESTCQALKDLSDADLLTPADCDVIP